MTFYESYINNLIENLTITNNKAIELDLILDSGGFKGSFLCGSLLYIKELEKKNYVKIRRISGSSVGAILGVLYCLDKLELYEELYGKIREDFKTNMNLKSLHNYIDELEVKLDKKEYEKLNNKMFINYFDIKTKKEEIISKYSSNSQVSNCLKFTSYLPIITDGKLHYKNKVDGSRPFIFQDRSKGDTKILYIDLNFIGKATSFLNTQKDKNGSGRILKGIMETHDFFSYHKTNNMCSYVNDWNIKDFAFYRLKEFIWIICIYLLTFSSYIYKNLSPYLNESLSANLINNVVKKFALDIYINIVFT